ncbi:MAG: BlaI/MecI/CopY family transcriptional regulator [Calditrichaeota bacterium]|nr:MAG: BlaI/MecI/CopY family transcriptional regulator [Calditrichota bacterium]
MKKRKKLNEAEWEVMEGVWHFSKPVTVRQVHSLLYPNGEKAYTTVQTFMNILVEKGFLKREKIGMVNFYAPNLSREDAAQMETKNLVSRIFHGSFGALANYLINSGELSEQDLQKIKNLIEKKERK